MSSEISNKYPEQGFSEDAWKKLGFFAGEQYLVFTFKKSQKLVAALYLISNLIKDSDPLKWEMREKGVNLLTAALALNTTEVFEKDVALRNIFSLSLDIVSLLELSVLSGIMSEMNYNILTHEFNSLVLLLQKNVEEKTRERGYVLSENFFKTDYTLKKDIKSTEENSIGHNETTLKVKDSLGSSSKTNKSTTTKTGSEIVIKDNRKDTIVTMLKQGETLTIKDFAKVITNCSEKTIQRELLNLVDKGVLKKEGERRWSKYSLK